MVESETLTLFAGNANPALAHDIARHLTTPLGRAYVGRFSDGEVNIELMENVRGRDVFIVQPTCPPTNDHLMELLVMVDACRRASAARITAVVPYFGYSRQDQPITETLGFALAEVSPGFALFTMTPQFRHYNPIGTVHGGVAATLLDSCMSCAVQTTMEAGLGYTTLEIKVNMVRPITEKTGPIRAEGRSLHTGRRSATAEGKILDANGTLLAHGTTTCIVFPL